MSKLAGKNVLQWILNIQIQVKWSPLKAKLIFLQVTSSVGETACLLLSQDHRSKKTAEEKKKPHADRRSPSKGFLLVWLCEALWSSSPRGLTNWRTWNRFSTSEYDDVCGLDGRVCPQCNTGEAALEKSQYHHSVSQVCQHICKKKKSFYLSH